MTKKVDTRVPRFFQHLAMPQGSFLVSSQALFRENNMGDLGLIVMTK